MNERVLVLRDAVVTITQMLAGNGIEVTQRGVNAYVKADATGKPVLVNLPFLPDNASDELCVAIQGFLDHEVAHIFFSDFTLIQKAVDLGCKSMLNILEDARIEKAMAKRFAGSGSNLSATGEFFIKQYVIPTMAEAAAAGDANKVIGVLIVPLIRAMSGQFIFKDFMKDKMHIIQDVYDKIADLAPAIERLQSTQECLDMAIEIEKRITDESGDAGKDGSGKAKGAASGDTKVKSLNGKAKDKKPKEEDEATAKSKDDEKKPEEDSAKDEGKDDADDDKSDGEESDPTEDEDEGKGERESDPSDDDELEQETDGLGTPNSKGEKDASDDDSNTGEGDGENDGEEDDADQDSKPPEKDGETSTGSAAALWSAIDEENKNGFDEKVSTLITNSAIDSAKTSNYLIYTKEGDVIAPLKVSKRDYSDSMFNSMADKVNHMVGPLQKDLERAISARSLVTWESGKRSGRLHSANLSRLATGDARVFRRRHESTSKDVAVELVIDASGSMGGAKIHLATQAAYALSSVLERIGIQHEVICFTTGETVIDRDAMEKEQERIGRPFTRIENLNMPIIKGFNERLKPDVKERFGWLPNSGILRNNVDGECIENALRRLMARREAGKVMIVLSDGAPNAYGGRQHELADHLKSVVKNATAAGVNMVGIGIMTSEVTKFYPKSVVINNVEELPTRVIRELKHLLIG